LGVEKAALVCEMRERFSSLTLNNWTHLQNARKNNRRRSKPGDGGFEDQVLKLLATPAYATIKKYIDNNWRLT